MKKVVLGLASILLVVAFAAWRGTLPSAARAVSAPGLENHSPGNQPLRNPSALDEPVSLEVPGESAVDNDRVAASEEGPSALDSLPSAGAPAYQAPVRLDWLGQALEWKRMRIQTPANIDILGPGDDWQATSQQADLAEVQVDGFYATPPQLDGTLWSSSLQTGAQILVLDAETREAIPDAYLRLPWPPTKGHTNMGFVRGPTFTTRASVDRGVVLAPSVVRTMPSYVCAPGYVSKDLPLGPGDTRHQLHLAPGFVAQVRARVSGDLKSTRIRVQRTTRSSEQYFPVVDPEHEVQITLPSGSHVAFLERKSSRANWKTLDRAKFTVTRGAQPARVELADDRPTAQLRGTVTVEPDGRARTVELTLRCQDVHDSAGSVEMRMASQNVRSWTMNGLLPGTYTLTALPGGLQQTVVIEPDLQPAPLHLDLRGAHQLKLHVVDAQTGRPIDNAMVSLGSSSAQTTADEMGTYTGFLLADEASIAVWSNGYKMWEQDLALTPGVNELRIELHPSAPCKLELDLQDAKGPVRLDLHSVDIAFHHLRFETPAGVQVRPSSYMVPSEEAPTTQPLTITFSEPGPVRLVLQLPGFQEAQADITLIAEETVRVNLLLQPE